MIVKILGMIAGIGISIFFGRKIGVDGLGVLSLATRVTSLFYIFVILGMGEVIVKKIAIGYENRDWNLVSDAIYSSSIINGILAIFLTLFGIALSPFISNYIFNTAELEIPLKISLIAMIPQVFNRIFASGLNGFRKIWQSNLVNETFSMYLVAFALIALYFWNIEIDVVRIATIYTITKAVVTLSVYIYWKKIFPYKIKAKWIGKDMLKTSMPLLLVSSTYFISTNADSIMLGSLASTYEVGLYNVAARLALLTSFFLQVSNSVISPKLAGLFVNGKIKEMEKMVKNVTFGLIIIASLSFIFFFLFGNFILNIWGEEFKEAYWVLVILAIGQFFNISSGCSGLILIMCGYEKIHGQISFYSLIFNLIINYFLILHYGAVGAAFATAITVSSENFLKLYYVKRKVGISPIPNVKRILSI